MFYVSVIDLAFFVKAALLWEGARVVTPFRFPPIIQIILTFTPLKLFYERYLYNDPFTPTISFQTSSPQPSTNPAQPPPPIKMLIVHKPTGPRRLHNPLGPNPTASHPPSPNPTLILTQLSQDSNAGINLTGYHSPGHPRAFAPKCAQPQGFCTTENARGPAQ